MSDIFDHGLDAIENLYSGQDMGYDTEPLEWVMEEKKFALVAELKRLQEEVKTMKGFQTQQVWYRIGDIKRELREMNPA